MKTVILKNIQKVDNGYSIFLGNGTAFRFNSFQKAKYYLNQTNKFLTTLLYEARELYGEISCRYNENWGYFLHNKKTMNYKIKQTDRCCNESLCSIDKLFDLIIYRCQCTNGSYLVFVQFNKIIDNLQQIVKQLSGISRTKSITADLYRYDSLFKRLQTLKMELNNYGQIQANYLFKIPAHILLKNEFIPENKIMLT